jgi:hypothetical protein
MKPNLVTQVCAEVTDPVLYGRRLAELNAAIQKCQKMLVEAKATIAELRSLKN